MNFYKFNVSEYDWILCIINPVERTETVIHNDRNRLYNYYQAHKTDLWIGYNSKNYDSVILKSVVLGFPPKTISDYIENEGLKEYQIDSRLKNVQLYNYDVMAQNETLEQLEAFKGDNITDTGIPSDRPLSEEELKQTVSKCMNDVEQIMNVFLERKVDFDSQLYLVKNFKQPFFAIGLTKTQLAANIIGCYKVERNDEFDIQIVDTLKLNKYKFVQDWFLNRNNRKYENKLEVNVCGVPHVFRWGGLHGCIEKPVHRKGTLIHIDVTSFYPTMMIVYEFLTRNCKNKDKYRQIYKKRIEFKNTGKLEESERYKTIVNSVYGASKDKFSKAYDPRQANNVSVNGQLLLLDLLEKLEGHCELIQSNTDGVIIQIKENDFELIDDICYEWEQRTKMKLEFEMLTEIRQGTVNDYIAKREDGSLIRKGAYVKELSDIDNDLPIINEAVVKYLTEGVLPEETINNCNDLIKFQKIYKISNKYKNAWHNGKNLTGKTFRIFASNNTNDTYIGKVKNSKIERFAETPPHCFIDNSDIKNKKTDSRLNKKWYIAVANKRLMDKFGCELKCDVTQFEAKQLDLFVSKPEKLPEEKEEFYIF